MARQPLSKQAKPTGEKQQETESPLNDGLLTGPGWASHEVKRDGAKWQYERYILEKDTKDNVIKFVENGYFTSFLRHWPRGQRPQVCAGQDKGCPMCARGDVAKPVYMFNVIDMTGDEAPLLKVWECTSDPFNSIKEIAEDNKYNPINRDDYYFEVTKKDGSNGIPHVSLKPIKKRDLQEDYGLSPLDEESYKNLTAEPYTKDIVYIPSREQLTEAASKLED